MHPRLRPALDFAYPKQSSNTLQAQNPTSPPPSPNTSNSTPRSPPSPTSAIIDGTGAAPLEGPQNILIENGKTHQHLQRKPPPGRAPPVHRTATTTPYPGLAACTTTILHRPRQRAADGSSETQLIVPQMTAPPPDMYTRRRRHHHPHHRQFEPSSTKTCAARSTRPPRRPAQDSPPLPRSPKSPLFQRHNSPGPTPPQLVEYGRPRASPATRLHEHHPSPSKVRHRTPAHAQHLKVPAISAPSPTPRPTRSASTI